jgi:TonB family protein
MRRLIFPALILLPVLAHAQAKTQTSTLTAAQSSAPATTLVAKANPPRILPAAPAMASADPGNDIMVPVQQTVVERSSEDVNTTDSTIGFSFNSGAVPATAPKLLSASPLAMSLRDMESQATEAAVTLELTVDLKGSPKNVKVVHSGGAALDKRAIEAVNRYRFKPAMQNNIPVEAPVTVAITVKKS